jgi:hypothetical protein
MNNNGYESISEVFRVGLVLDERMPWYDSITITVHKVLTFKLHPDSSNVALTLLSVTHINWGHCSQLAVVYIFFCNHVSFAICTSTFRKH